MKKILLHSRLLLVVFAATLFLSSPLTVVLAQTSSTTGFGFDKVNNVAQQAGYNPGNEQTLDQRISSFIAIFLSFLGVIFMILMIYGGYNWMTAAGDEKKIDRAKDTIRAAIIGLVIIVAAYAISVFIVSRIWGVTTTSFIPIAYAQTGPTITPSASPVLDRLNSVGTGAGYGAASQTSVLDILGIVINGLLGLLGAIFILLIIIAGLNWMTAGGDEAKIDKAKDTIRAAIIGLIIIVGAFAIWNFISTYLLAGGGSSGHLQN